MRIMVDGQGSRETHEELRAVADKLIDVFLDNDVDCSILQLQMCHNRVTCTIDSSLDKAVVFGYVEAIGGKPKTDQIYGARVYLDGVEVALSQHGSGSALASR